MVRRRIKWKFIFLLQLVLLNVFTKSLPIDRSLPSIVTTDTVFSNLVIPEADVKVDETGKIDEAAKSDEATKSDEVPEAKALTKNATEATAGNATNDLIRNLRPGQEVRVYTVELSANGDSFEGRVVIDVNILQGTNEDPLLFYCEDLEIHAVRAGILSIVNAVDADFFVEDGILSITPVQIAITYKILIEYTGQIRNDGTGIYEGSFNDNSYLAMNLYPTHARRVFPCMDEPTETATISFTFNDFDFNHLVTNSLLEVDSQNTFRPLQGPPHLWGMVAHNLVNLMSPTANVPLFGPSGVSNQEAQASVAINHFYNALNEWTDKPYLEIIVDQNGNMNILVLPDMVNDWYALSTVCIWEPYVLMETIHSVTQRKTSFIKIAEAMARQWFGYVIYPENWKYEWVVSGLGIYAAYEITKTFQESATDVTLLDINTIFVTDVIQESLLQDSFLHVQVLEPEEEIFEEDMIRDQVNGLLKLKAPAIMRMLRLILGDDDEHDFIQSAAKALLSSRSLQTVNAPNFYDAINSEWLFADSGLIDEVPEFLEPWLQNEGYPLIHVGLRQTGVLITQERFGFTARDQVNYMVPLTYTTSAILDFDNVYPFMMSEGTTALNFAIGEEDWVLFNIQGQGYYRVNYDAELWERIIEALCDPEQREEIHELNRATLVDDVLNLARASKIDYDIAFRVVLAMEHETDYAVWKAFVRNMEFLRKRLLAYVAEEEDERDPDIYLRMVRRTIGAVEDELGFYPDPLVNEPAMTTLTRGLVMEHACKANYQPCIAAAVDWFYDPNSDDLVVNPNIPHEIRPAVYCTMMREGDDQVIAALYDRLEIEPTRYERVVILESLGCSQDEDFVRILLEETIANNSPYSVEERSKIFAAVARSSYDNARVAANFMSLRTAEIRNMYGGALKLEELIMVLAENMADGALSADFSIWVNSLNSNIEDSMLVAERALEQVNENLEWDNANLELVYEWIDENDAPTLMVSLVLICVSFIITILN